MSRSACPGAITTLPARFLPAAKLASLPDKITDPAQIVPGTRPGIWPSPIRRRNWTTISGLARRRWSLISKRASTRTGAGTTTPAAGNLSTGSATMAISRIGDSDSIRPAHRRSRATAISAGQRPLEHRDHLQDRMQISQGSHHYPGDVSFTIAGGHPPITMGTKWIGTDGWVWVDRGGFDASNPEWIKADSLPEELRKVKLYESATPAQLPRLREVAQAGHRSRPDGASLDMPGHLGLISMLVGRKLQWDVAGERSHDSAASELLSRPYRAPEIGLIRQRAPVLDFRHDQEQA